MNAERALHRRRVQLRALRKMPSQMHISFMHWTIRVCRQRFQIPTKMHGYAETSRPGVFMQSAGKVQEKAQPDELREDIA
eukprot:scaffold279603_cov16-Tisochrysis_lutea.AAC.2